MVPVLTYCACHLVLSVPSDCSVGVPMTFLEVLALLRYMVMVVVWPLPKSNTVCPGPLPVTLLRSASMYSRLLSSGVAAFLLMACSLKTMVTNPLGSIVYVPRLSLSVPDMVVPVPLNPAMWYRNTWLSSVMLPWGMTNCASKRNCAMSVL